MSGPALVAQATDIKGRGAGIVDEKLEVVVIPVSDVDARYMVAEQAGTELPT
jgi:hypothetical protein